MGVLLHRAGFRVSVAVADGTRAHRLSGPLVFFASELSVTLEFGRSIAIAILVFLAVFYFAVPVALYLYTVLSGGVMSRKERTPRDGSADF